jgi:hypothetical protein
LANGVLNHSSKDFAESKILGRKKLKRATDEDVGLPRHFFRYPTGDRIIIHPLIVRSVVRIDLSTESSPLAGPSSCSNPAQLPEQGSQGRRRSVIY